MWGVRGFALFHARPPVLRACSWGPLSTGCGCSARGWGPVTNPTARSLACWLCALRGWHEGAPGGGGVSCLGVGPPWFGPLSRPTARLSGVQPGPATHWLWVRCAGVGTCHQPHSARSCELAFRAAGAPQGGGVSCLGVGRPWLGTLPRPTARPSGVRPGPISTG